MMVASLVDLLDSLLAVSMVEMMVVMMVVSRAEKKV
jgi:hypothetical protein